MRRFSSLLALIGMTVGSMAITGCESSDRPDAHDSRYDFDGGNGAFGESALQPGYYPKDRHNNPTTQPSPPAVSSDH
jgi:hypothetical protein